MGATVQAGWCQAGSEVTGVRSSEHTPTCRGRRGPTAPQVWGVALRPALHKLGEATASTGREMQGVVVRQGSTTTLCQGAWARPTPAHCSGQGAQGSEGS